jgi:hypothetical protein
MMNISEEFARARIRDPLSNNVRATRKTFCAVISVCLDIMERLGIL